MADKHYGLLLTRPGAPLNPHTIITDDGPIPDQFHPTVPTPVGEDCPVSLEDAKKYDKAKDIPLKLVELSTRKANEAEKAHEAFGREAPDGAGGSN